MTALDSLGDYCGIVSSFVDARRETRTTTPETRLRLLEAMGIAATDDASAGHVLAELQARDAERSLPPVVVHYRASGPLDIAINRNLEPQPSRWRLELENGTVLEGRTTQRLRIEEELPCGYHTLSLEPGGGLRCSLIVTPGQCWLPPGAEAGRQWWGFALQLYLVRSATNWGIGDFGDLERLVQALAARGADVVGLNPLHAMFPDDPEQASPYSPASRLLLNILTIDVARAADSVDCEAVRARMGSVPFKATLARCREARVLDYSGVASLKLPVLRELFDCRDCESRGWHAFVEFRATAGAAFERSCVFLALRAHFAHESAGTADWHQWPVEYRSASSAAVMRYAQDHADSVTFQAWLQFIADSQLRECMEAASDMAVGLYRDLAVGASASGAETWANPTAVIDAARVGAPPDIHNPQGQNWGLPPLNPRALRAEGYRSFIDLVRANMRHAGGLRIDHVMALRHLWWIPEGHPAWDGAYVRYPLEDLVGILALESHRNECLVVGEDLGTVPDGFRERMEVANILSYRVLFFEKDADGFIAPGEYPRLAIAIAGSHDLPTLRAWWLGEDLVLKRKLQLYPTPSHALQAAEGREEDRRALGKVLREHRWVGDTEIDVEQFVDAAHAFLGQTRSIITMLQVDDVIGEVDPVNVPSTSHEHPNWRRRLSVTLEQLLEDSRFIAATAALAKRSDAEVSAVDP